MRISTAVLSSLISLVGARAALADTTTQSLPLTQAWTDVNLITTDDDWSGVPGIQGFRGDNLTGGQGTDPQTILADGSGTPLDVNEGRSDPALFATGGVTEFELANPVVALQGSSTADAPHLVVRFATTGRTAITVAYNLRDLDASNDDAQQAVALHYRVGGTGTWTNVAAAFVADATEKDTATKVTAVSVVLPAAVENKALVEIRIMTTNAAGNDEWVGIDDLSITGTAGGATCGNGVLEAGEDCDSGVVTACCSASCTFLGAETTCRASTGACDPAETCGGGSETCPADVRQTGGETCDDGNACTIATTCDGAGACGDGDPAVTASTLTVDFGDVPVDGSSSSDLLRLSNAQTAGLTVSSMILAGSEDFAFEDIRGSDLEPGLMTTVGTSFTPSAEGEVTATITITIAGCDTLVITLRGNGVAGAPDAGPVDAGAGDVDASAGDVDAGAGGIDAGALDPDASTAPDGGGGGQVDAGGGSGGGGGGDGCGCRTSTPAGDAGAALLAALVLGAVWPRRRRRS